MQINRRSFHRLLLLGAGYRLLPLGERAFALPSSDIAQPFAAQVRRVLKALDAIGEPLQPDDARALQAILAHPPDSSTVGALDAVLRRHALLEVEINPEGRVAVTRGSARAILAEHGWRSFLVRVSNLAGETPALRFRSPQALPMGRPSGNETDSVHDFTIGAVDAVEAQQRWIALNSWDKPPMMPTLSGLALEYRILQIYSRDHGQREASIEAATGPGEQDLGFRSTVAILFDCVAAHALKLHILDRGAPVTASLLITDPLGRIYPAQSKRALPDLWFQPQIYRRDQEVVALPEGSYTIRYTRGPEYVSHALAVQVAGGAPTELRLDLERWIRPEQLGYYSGDTHIHAAGCSHYESPSEGVTPEVMLRQSDGEALDLGSVLTWAPGFRYQSQFFSGHTYQPRAANEQDETLLRYDLEVSGFPSSHAGHLVLLRLKEEIYPGTTTLDDWPSWNLPLLRWAKAQGAVTGYAHSGHGMVVDSTELPNYLMPPFDSCGANEYIVDVTHDGVLDFISGCDLWPFAELNLWYHVLNCGYRLRFAGETDFPCISDHCVGGGRSYVHLERPLAGDSGYSDWLVRGLQQGHSYFGDGRSHIFDLQVKGAAQGQSAAERIADRPFTAAVTAKVCARLEPAPAAETEEIRNASPYDPPYWHLERARIGQGRRVPVELVVNGESAGRQEFEADGTMRDISFEVPLTQSSWVALRIYPSAHTNPVFVTMAGKPVRASKKSAEWCRRAVDVCWEQKMPRIRESECAAAKAAYDHARAAYDRILSDFTS